TYTVVILDSNGCSDTDIVTVHPSLEAQVLLTKLLDCSPTPDAEITLNVTSGSGNYDYEITNGLGMVVSRIALPTNPFTVLVNVPETYTVTIFDRDTTTPECNRVFVVEVPAAVAPVF